ncbi:hypothetical protein [uncultured Campylobacter sp.]|uniref:hypothetical protein n=1 Tax=uncultured Campylobacter sp. TaxID=218934 RepID=UPI002609C46B|nr:hypothetical protein [uncultured Campylobacter sp.]
MQLHYETRPTKHRAPNSLSRGLLHNGFWRATRVLALQISRCERLRYSATSLQRATNFSLIYSRAASQACGNFSCLCSRKTLHIGAA